MLIHVNSRCSSPQNRISFLFWPVLHTRAPICKLDMMDLSPMWPIWCSLLMPCIYVLDCLLKPSVVNVHRAFGAKVLPLRGFHGGHKCPRSARCCGCCYWCGCWLFMFYILSLLMIVGFDSSLSLLFSFNSRIFSCRVGNMIQRPAWFQTEAIDAFFELNPRPADEYRDPHVGRMLLVNACGGPLL